MNDQGSFDFDQAGDESGFRQWQGGNETRKKEIEAEFGLILGKRVRLNLRQINKEVEGIIYYRLEKNKVVLSIGTFEFAPDDIVSMVRV